MKPSLKGIVLTLLPLSIAAAAIAQGQTSAAHVDIAPAPAAKQPSVIPNPPPSVTGPAAPVAPVAANPAAPAAQDAAAAPPPAAPQGGTQLVLRGLEKITGRPTSITATIGKPVKIATLDLFPGHPVGAQRHNGFLAGYGLKSLDAKSNELAQPAEVVCMADSYGDAAKGQTGMENCLQKNPNINVVYAINEPAAAGAYKALKAAGKDKDVVILGVDGMCSNGVGNVEKGVIAATSMQYPLKMAALGVAAGVKYAKDGKRQTGYTDTGVDLVAAKPMAGVKSIDTKTARGQCWGD